MCNYSCLDLAAILGVHFDGERLNESILFLMGTHHTIDQSHSSNINERYKQKFARLRALVMRITPLQVVMYRYYSSLSTLNCTVASSIKTTTRVWNYCTQLVQCSWNSRLHCMVVGQDCRLAWPSGQSITFLFRVVTWNVSHQWMLSLNMALVLQQPNPQLIFYDMQNFMLQGYVFGRLITMNQKQW